VPQRDPWSSWSGPDAPRDVLPAGGRPQREPSVPPPASKPRRSPGRTPTRGARGKTKILIVAANPLSQTRLRLDQEMREIEDGLERAKRRDSFELILRLAVRPRDLQKALLSEKPQIVHFCGHGSRDGDLMLEDELGNVNAVTTEALAKLFDLCSQFVECVVLNACHTRIQADAIARHIPYVIGMNKAIGDKAAIRFAVGFYDALGAGTTYDDAYHLGCSLLSLENIPEDLTPVLTIGEGPLPDLTDFRVLGRMNREEINGMIQQYKTAMATEGGDAEAHYILGLCYLQLRLYDLAIRHFRSVIDLDPALADGYYYLALASIRGRRPKTLMLQEARAVESNVSAAIELDPEPAKYYYLLAIVRQDYYRSNGLRPPSDSPETLLGLAESKEPETWEIERLLASLPLNDTALLSRIRRETPTKGA